MILVVTLNPALDVTHHVAGADWSGVNRPHSVEVQAGGKGLNVARTLRALGQPVMLTGLVGGLTGHAVLGGLTGAGIDSALTQIADETRRTFAVSDTVRGETALFNEPGPVIQVREFERFCVAYEKRLQSCAAVVLAGSLPRGLPAHAYASLIAAAIAAGVPVVLDTSGLALGPGAAAKPTLVKPNLAELEEAAGRPLGAADGPDLAAIDQAARRLAGLAAADWSTRHPPGAGTNSVIVSLGGHGLLAVCPGGTLLARPPAKVAGNPTGSGDAAVAGLADGLVRGRNWPELLAHATALGTAAAGTSPAWNVQCGGIRAPGTCRAGHQALGRLHGIGPHLMLAIGTGEIVAAARERSRGVAALNVIGIEHAEAIVAGAQAAAAPVILAISENCVAYHGALEPIALAVLAIARAATVPVSVHLDHATRSDLVRAAVGIGISSVMFDASARDYAANVTATAALAAWCRERAVWVEAELGEIGGKDGVHAPGARTDPAEAAAYVEATGVNAIAVAVGSSHAMLTRTAVVDLDLIARIRARVPAAVPLVLHGSSGVPDDALRATVSAGMTKINIATQLNKVFTAAVRERLAADERLVDPRKYGAAGRDAVADEVARLLGVLGWPGAGGVDKASAADSGAGRP